MSKEKIRVVVIDDHAGIRAGIKTLLRGARDISVVGEGADGLQAIELAATKKPDILLLDVELPVVGGDIVMRRIHEAEPRVKVLVVSAYDDRAYIQSMIANGASGYLTKDEAPVLLLQAVYAVLDGNGNWLSPRALRNAAPASMEEQTLTEREVSILRQLLDDRSEAEIALAMRMEAQQVNRFLRVMMNKFEAESLDVLRAVARRILRPHAPEGGQHGQSGSRQP